MYTNIPYNLYKLLNGLTQVTLSSAVAVAAAALERVQLVCADTVLAWTWGTLVYFCTKNVLSALFYLYLNELTMQSVH